MLPKWLWSLAALATRAAVNAKQKRSATTKAHPKSIETLVKLPALLDARLSERRYWEPRDCKVDECYSAL